MDEKMNKYYSMNTNVVGLALNDKGFSMSLMLEKLRVCDKFTEFMFMLGAPHFVLI